MDLRAGPQEPKPFGPGETVSCDFTPHARSGLSAKFYCRIAPLDEVKVKYGVRNSEVYAEVAGTRLLWALGFGADHMYSVKVRCRGCPLDPFHSDRKEGDVVQFDPAAIERRMMGGGILETYLDSGWAWRELDLVDEAMGGAPLAQRDALKLLAVFIQHTDTKPAQQRLICLDKPVGADSSDGNGHCAHPFMLIDDLGTTFGHANTFNRDAPGSVNFRNWSQTPVWRDAEKAGCTGNLPRSITGTIDNPRIGEAGRKFLANLLVQLTDTQIHDLFDVAQFARRDQSASTGDWVRAFYHKRDEIVNRTCSNPPQAAP